MATKADKVNLEELKKKYKKIEKEVKQARKANDDLGKKLEKRREELMYVEKDVSDLVQVRGQTIDALAMEKRKKNREIYDKIDRLCEVALDEFVEEADILDAEVILEGQTTTITIDESVASTFGELKILVAQLYYLNEKDFFLADMNDNIYLDELPVRPALSRIYGRRIKGPPPKIKVILREFKNYGELLGNRRFATIETEDANLLANRSPSSGKRKEAPVKSSFQKLQDIYRRTKGCIMLAMFIALIVLFIIHLYSTSRIGDRYFFKQSLESGSLLKIFDNATDVTDVVEKLLITPNASSDLEAVVNGFFYSYGKVIATHYDIVTCPDITSSDLKKLYTDKSLVCKNGTGEDRMTPLVFTDGTTNKTVEYSDSVEGSTIYTEYGPYQTRGFAYEFTLSSVTTDLVKNTVNGIFNFSSLRYATLILNYADPAAELVAQVNFYTAIYNYNVTKNGIVANVLSMKRDSPSDKGITTSILVLTGILLFIAVLERVRFVARKNESLDKELVLYNEKQAKKKRGEVSTIDLRKFWVFKNPLLIFIVYLPSASEISSFVGLCLIIASISIRTVVVDQLHKFDFNKDNDYFDLSDPFYKLSNDKAIIDSFVLVLIMFGLINQIVEFLRGDLIFYQKVIGRVSAEYKWFAPLLAWLLFVGTLSNMVLFGNQNNVEANFGQSFFRQMRQTLGNLPFWEVFYDPKKRYLFENGNRQIGYVNFIIPSILIVVIAKYIFLPIFIALVVGLFPEVREMVRETKKTLKSLNNLSFKSIKFGKKKNPKKED